MKKVSGIWLCVAVICVGMIGGCGTTNQSFNEIKVNDLLNAVEKKERMVVYYGQEDCSACGVLSKMLEEQTKDTKEKVYYLDADQLSVTDKETLKSYYVTETPTLIIANNGEMYFYRDIDSATELERALGNMDIYSERINGLQNIEYELLMEKYENGTDFFVYIGREDCRDCQKFYPLLEQYIDKNEDQGVYYLDIKKYRDLAKAENATEEDIAFYDDFREEFQMEWVPSLYHLRNNMIVSKYEFLDEAYYRLDENLQAEREQEFIDEFHEWMEREFIRTGANENN